MFVSIIQCQLDESLDGVKNSFTIVLHFWPLIVKIVLPLSCIFDRQLLFPQTLLQAWKREKIKPIRDGTVVRETQYDQKYCFLKMLLFLFGGGGGSPEPQLNALNRRLGDHCPVAAILDSQDSHFWLFDAK